MIRLLQSSDPAKFHLGGKNPSICNLNIASVIELHFLWFDL